MRFSGALGGVAAAAPICVMASMATAVPLTNNPVATEAGLLTGLVALDLSGIVSGLTTTNSLTSNFMAPGGAYTGSLTASVYGNVGAPGTSLDTVVIVYEFTGNGPSGIDQFIFGIDSGINLDFGATLAATHGSVGDLTSVGQATPNVDLFDNSGVPSNDTMVFDFLAAGDTLGGVNQTDTFGWYVQSSADIAINLVDVQAVDFGSVVFQSLAIVDNPGQPDLNIPAPGSAVMLLGFVGAAARRRRH